MNSLEVALVSLYATSHVSVNLLFNFVVQKDNDKVYSILCQIQDHSSNSVLYELKIFNTKPGLVLSHMLLSKGHNPCKWNTLLIHKTLHIQELPKVPQGLCKEIYKETTIIFIWEICGNITCSSHYAITCCIVYLYLFPCWQPKKGKILLGKNAFVPSA